MDISSLRALAQKAPARVMCCDVGESLVPPASLFKFASTLSRKPSRSQQLNLKRPERAFVIFPPSTGFYWVLI